MSGDVDYLRAMVQSAAEEREFWKRKCKELTAELAAREAAAFKRGQEAMREKAANHVRRLLLPDDCGPDEAHGRFQQAIASCEAIRALPVEEMPTHHVEVKRVADLTDAEAESLFGADNDEG